MISDEQLLEQIEQVTKDFSGQLDYLYEAVGMITTGRLLGWRVMRLVASGRCWTLATRLFGDPKLLMPERGKYYDKSLGCNIIDTTIEKSGEYWEYIKRQKSIPISERKLIH